MHYSEGPQPSQEAARLSSAYLFYHRGFKSQKLLLAAVGYMEQLLEDGGTEELIMAEITRKGRRRTEPIWEFEKRVRAQLKDVAALVGPDGEIDVRLEDWSKFMSAYIAEWPRFGGDYSFLQDWRDQPPFRDATLEQLLYAIRKVRADVNNAKHTNKFPLLAAAVREARRIEARPYRSVAEPEPTGPLPDDGRPDDQCDAPLLRQRYGFVKAAKMIADRRKAQ